jgi:DNA-3-methyladenine glycosylase
MDFGWLDVPVEEAARALLGRELVRVVDGETMRVRIVETEAYDQNDPASHTFRGRTPRNAAMFMPAGHAYVYRSMGIHHCLNMVAGPEGFGEGVLIRAVGPLEGEDVMVARRGGRTGALVTNGPGKLCQALAVDLSLTGHPVGEPPLQLVQRSPLPDEQIVTTTRIGISKAVDWPRRFYDRGSTYVSKR